jgi:predicted methyltransferase
MRQFLTITTLIGIVAFSGVSHVEARTKAKNAPAAPTQAQPAAIDPALTAAVAGDWRSEADRARDAQRHPAATLAFWGVRPNATVVEIRPGGGYWTDILAPYLASGGGKLIVTSGDPEKMTPTQIEGRDRFLKRYQDNPSRYGTLGLGVFAANSDKPLAPAGTVDVIVSSRNFHGFVLQNIKDYAIRSMYTALKPGGLVGIEQHRGDARRAQNPASGYMRQDWIISEMRKGGFEFVGASEINANPADTKDHPFGVWTLPPVLQTAPNGQPANPAFDNAKYKAIGESDRMTLLFRKPA